MQLKKIQTRIFCGQKPKVFIKIKYPEQVAEPESCVTVRIFLFGAVSSKKRYLPTAPHKNYFTVTVITLYTPFCAYTHILQFPFLIALITPSDVTVTTFVLLLS